MNMHALLVAAAAWSVAAPVTTKDPIKEEMKLLQGRWAPVYVETEGKPIPPEGMDDLKDLEIVVEGERVTLKEEGQVKDDWKITFRIDPTKTPKTIDLSISVEGTMPKTGLGIYKLAGDMLEISILPPTKEPERATDFNTKPGSRNLLWRFKRK
jgi:uncharacterized protein (TIGR03067 family)